MVAGQRDAGGYCQEHEPEKGELALALNVPVVRPALEPHQAQGAPGWPARRSPSLEHEVTASRRCSPPIPITLEAMPSLAWAPSSARKTMVRPVIGARGKGRARAYSMSVRQDEPAGSSERGRPRARDRSWRSAERRPRDQPGGAPRLGWSSTRAVIAHRPDRTRLPHGGAQLLLAGVGYITVRLGPVSSGWISTTHRIPAQAFREDRILHEANLIRGDVRRFGDHFDLTVGGATLTASPSNGPGEPPRHPTSEGSLCVTPPPS